MNTEPDSMPQSSTSSPVPTSGIPDTRMVTPLSSHASRQSIKIIPFTQSELQREEQQHRQRIQNSHRHQFRQDHRANSLYVDAIRDTINRSFYRRAVRSVDDVSLIPNARDTSRRTSLWDRLNLSRILRHRSGVYEEVGEASNSGLRVWYEDYSSIDWIHDLVKERIRIRLLRQDKSILGQISTHIDAVQAWVVLSIIGFTAGTVASFLYLNYTWLTDLKLGYCSSNIWFRKDLCCGKSHFNCQQWIPWSELFGVKAESEPWISYSAFVVLSVLLAYLSSIMVTWSADSPETEQSALHAYQTSTNEEETTPLLGTRQPPPGRVFYHAAGSGIPEVKTILGGFVIRGFLGMRTLITKTLGLIFSLASGLVIGLQGPLVHISCAIGNIVSRVFLKYSKNEGKRREILSAACAAGVSVAFGSPIGGILFSLEEVSYYFPLKTMLRSFYCALVGAVTLKILNPMGTGKLVVFQVSYDEPWHVVEFVPFLLLGIFGGVYGAFFNHMCRMVNELKTSLQLNKYPIAEVVLVAFFTSALSYLFPLTRMGNSELVALLFSDCDPKAEGLLCNPENYIQIIQSLGITLVIKIVLIITTIGLFVPGGIFVPSMVVGALAGRIVGTLALYFQHRNPTHIVFSFCESQEKCLIPGVYAMVGAAASLSGVTRMAVSLTVIMFELTGNINYVLPIMLSIMVAKWVGDAFNKDSFMDMMIKRNGFPYLDFKHQLVVEAARASDVMVRDCEMLIFDTVYRLEDIEGKLMKLRQVSSSCDDGFPVVKSNGILIGYIAQTELEHALMHVKATESTTPKTIIIHNLLKTSVDIVSPELQAPISFHEESESQVNVVQPGDDVESEDDNSIQTVDISEWVDQTPLSTSTLSSVELVLEMFIKLGVRTLCVVNEGKLAGLIHKKHLLRFLENQKNR